MPARSGSAAIPSIPCPERLPAPPPVPSPIPPRLPGPPEGAPGTPSGKPSGRFDEGCGSIAVITMAGSIASFGFSATGTTIAGVNCRCATRGRRPRLGGVIDLEPPPPCEGEGIGERRIRVRGFGARLGLTMLTGDGESNRSSTITAMCRRNETAMIRRKARALPTRKAPDCNQQRPVGRAARSQV